MKIINQEIATNFQFKYSVKLRTEKGQIIPIKVITDTVHTINLKMIPDLQDNIKVELLPKRYKSITKYLENGKPVAYFSGANMLIDCTETAPTLTFSNDIDLFLYEKDIKEFATTNINRPEWKDGVSADDLRKLTIDDIFNLYHQTLHRGVSM